MENTKITGIHYASRKPVRLELDRGRITAVEELGPVPLAGDGKSEQLPVVAPGLVELQINGYKGIDLNAPGLSVEQVLQFSRNLLATGVCSYYPTLITGDPDKISASVAAIARARQEDAVSAAMIKGIHLEGPFICGEDGPRGAHPKAWVRKPDPSLVDHWQEEAKGDIRILTLAPELPGSIDLIRKCVDMGITVSIGHTSADTDSIRAAVEAGARLSTHLGNGCHGMLPRHPNYIWDQLAETELYASMIGDGYHLPVSVLKVFYQVKQQKAILISDAMTYAGMEPGAYESPAIGKVVLTPEGKLHMAGRPKTLAGSASSLIMGVRHMSRIIGFTKAWDMGSLNPSRLTMGEKPMGLQAGAAADLVLLEPEKSPSKIREVVLEGKRV